MKGRHNKKSVRVEFVMSEAEAELVKERMAELGITNLSAYLRKMAVDGYIIHLDMGDIQEMIRLLRICSNNLMIFPERVIVNLIPLQASSNKFLIGINWEY